MKHEGMPLRLMTCGSVLGGKSSLAGQLLDASRLAVAPQAFVVDDMPGTVQHAPAQARDLVAAAVVADVAIVAIDARAGLGAQVRRHSHLASLCGTPKLVVAVNKLDLVGYAQDVFDRIAANPRVSRHRAVRRA